MGNLSLEEARKAVASNEVEVIDLRDDDGWVDDGHIPGAHRAGDDLDQTLEDIDDDRKLLIVCADGKRSSEVAEELDGGDREAVSLEGGMEAWNKEGLRTQPAQDYEPGPEPVEGEDPEKAAAAAEGLTDFEGEDEDGDSDAESESESDDAEPEAATAEDR